MPLLPATEIPPGTWGRGIFQHTVEASADAGVQGVGPVWPPAFSAAEEPAVTGQANRADVGFTYVVTHYLVSFDTSFVTRNRSVIATTLRLIPQLVQDADGMVLHNDQFSWDSPAGAAHYDPSNQPGNDGAVALAEAKVGEALDFTCRPGKVVRHGNTQYRLTVAGAVPAGTNWAVVNSLLGLQPPQLILLTTNTVGLWEM